MNKLYRIFYSATAKFVLGRHCRLFSDVNILVASSYLMIKKMFGFSISNWLLANALHQPLVNIYVYVSAAILLVSIVIKILSLIFENLPPAQHVVVEPEEISSCLQAINLEISGHLKRCNSGELLDIRRLNEQHSLEVNVRLIVEALAEHIRKSFNSVKVKRKDIFISLYTLNTGASELTYELHFDQRRDLIKSKTILLNDDKHKNYECVKCMNSENSTVYVLSRSRYPESVRGKLAPLRFHPRSHFREGFAA